MGTHYQGGEAVRAALDSYIKLLRATEAVTSGLNSRIVAAGLTWSQFGALEALLHRGSMCQRDLGEKLLKSTGNVTMVVDNLEKRGLVRRERSAEDRRYITVHLTDTGRELIERLFPEHAAAIAARMSVLEPEELAELGRLCKKLGLGAP
ncbi:MAG: MarR family winged helix-turn-helix transcriptional regulator [Armatimonadota bacterium]